MSVAYATPLISTLNTFSRKKSMMVFVTEEIIISVHENSAAHSPRIRLFVAEQKLYNTTP